MGGGGRGIRVVPTANDLSAMFDQASSEAANAFEDGRCLYVDPDYGNMNGCSVATHIFFRPKPAL
jgi:biotin carboxylase